MGARNAIALGFVKEPDRDIGLGFGELSLCKSEFHGSRSNHGMERGGRYEAPKRLAPAGHACSPVRSGMPR